MLITHWGPQVEAKTFKILPVTHCLLWRYITYLSLTSPYAMIPFAFPLFTDGRNQSPQHYRRANGFALVLFTLTALGGLAVKYLP